MTGLRSVERDASWLSRFSRLRPPTPEEVCRASARMLRGPTTCEVAEWVYARWKPGHSLTTVHRLTLTDGTRELLTWKAYEDEKARSLAERSTWFETTPDTGAWEQHHWIDPARGLELWAVPFDRELPGLRRAQDERWVARTLEGIGAVPERSVRRRRLEQELLRYKPQRRAVLRGRAALRPTGSFEYALRVLVPGAAERAILARRGFDPGAGGELAPRLLLGDERRGILLEEWRPGHSRDREDFSDPTAIGELLGRWHAVPLVDAAPPAARRSLAGARELLRTVLERDPELAPDIAPIAGRPRRTWVHGDFHPDQVHETGGALTLLDLDELGVGEPERDLASWLADAACSLPEAEYREHRGALLESYRRRGPVDETTLEHFVARALVHRAAACLRRLEVDAPAHAERILALLPRPAAGGAPT